MPRPKRNKPYNPAKQVNSLEVVHDRRAVDLVRGAMVAEIIVDDPFAPGEQIATVRSIRSDPLARLHTHHQINDAQYQGGRAFQEDWERIERGAQAMDPSKPFVDCSRSEAAHVSDAYSKAFKRLNQVVRQLGLDGSAITQDVLIHGRNFTVIAASRGSGEGMERHIGNRFQQCLTILAVFYGFAIEEE